MKLAGRLEAMGSPIYRGLTTKTKCGYVWNGKVELSNHGQVIKPLSWRRPRRVFVNSMSDLFHESVPDAWIDRVFAVMALCPQHTFQVLTKRAGRMRDYLRVSGSNDDPDAVHQRILTAAYDLLSTKEEGDRLQDLCEASDPPLPLSNLWLGVSVEDQARADERIPLLLETPAAVRWISAEPLLEDVNIVRYLWKMIVAPHEELTDHMVEQGWSHKGGQGDHPFPDWVVIGGESGPRARRFNIEWARSLIDQCKDAGVPVFMKQIGANPMETRPCSEPGMISVRIPDLTDRKGSNPSDWPSDLRVREYPAQKRAG